MLKVKIDLPSVLDAGCTWQRFSDTSVEYTTQTGVRFKTCRSGYELHLTDQGLNAIIPPEVEAFIASVSFYDYFSEGLDPYRQPGEYRFGSAVGKLEVTIGGDVQYCLQLQAKTLSDIRELNARIRSGKCWPDIDYGAEQVPPPCRHLRQLLAEAWQIIRRDVSDRVHNTKQQIKPAN